MPDPAKFRNPWEPQSEEENKKEEEKKEEEKHFQDEKFLLNRDFGEGSVGKKNPAIFVFDLIKNTLNQVQGLDEDLYP